jgi:ribosome recycling factor
MLPARQSLKRLRLLPLLPSSALPLPGACCLTASSPLRFASGGREQKTRSARAAASPAPSKPAAPPLTEDDDGSGGGGARYGKDFPSQLARQVDYCKREFSKVRGATATPEMLDGVLVTAYGDTQPLKDVAQVSQRGPLLLVVSPFDSALLEPVAEAIRGAELGLNPQAEGSLLRVPVPRASKETREAAAKLVAAIAEQAKTRVRRVRAAEMGRLKELTGVSEDDVKRDTKRAEDAVAAAVATITKLAAEKKIAVEKE